MCPAIATNASCVLVQTKTTLDSAFKARAKLLNQKLGDKITVAPKVYTNASTNITPYATSNAVSYIWVNNNAANTANTIRGIFFISTANSAIVAKVRLA